MSFVCLIHFCVFVCVCLSVHNAIKLNFHKPGNTNSHKHKLLSFLLLLLPLSKKPNPPNQFPLLSSKIVLKCLLVVWSLLCCLFFFVLSVMSIVSSDNVTLLFSISLLFGLYRTRPQTPNPCCLFQRFFFVSSNSPLCSICSKSQQYFIEFLQEIRSSMFS